MSKELPVFAGVFAWVRAVTPHYVLHLFALRANTYDRANTRGSVQGGRVLIAPQTRGKHTLI